MTGQVFRPDIQDEVLRLLFDKHRINLLKVPRQDLEPGHVFLVPETANGTLFAYGPVDLQRIVPGAVVPQVHRDIRLADVEGTSSNSAETRAEAGIFARFLQMLWPGAWLPDISARVEVTGAKNLLYRFSEATRDGFDFSELGHALGTRSPDLSFLRDGANVRIYVVVDVYRCSKIEMTWTDESGNIIGAEVAMEALAKAEAKRGATSSTRGKVTVDGDVALAFGVRLMELVRRDEGSGLALRLDHTRLDVLGGEERSEDGQRLADEGDYTLLADPWDGEMGLDIKPLPS